MATTRKEKDGVWVMRCACGKGKWGYTKADIMAYKRRVKVCSCGRRL